LTRPRISNLQERIHVLTDSAEQTKRNEKLARWRAHAEYHYDHFLALTLREELVVLGLFEGEVQPEKPKRHPQVPRDEFVRKSVRAEELRHMTRIFTEEEQRELTDLNNWLWQVHHIDRAECEDCRCSNWDRKLTSKHVFVPYNTTRTFCEACWVKRAGEVG
jgi:hypothetical protein